MDAGLERLKVNAAGVTKRERKFQSLEVIRINELSNAFNLIVSNLSELHLRKSCILRKLSFWRDFWFYLFRTNAMVIFIKRGNGGDSSTITIWNILEEWVGRIHNTKTRYQSWKNYSHFLQFFSYLFILRKNKLTRSDVAIHLTLSHTSGCVWYKGLEIHFLPPPHFGRLVFTFLVIWWSTDYVYKIWLSFL